MTVDELKRAMAIIIDKHESTRAAELIYQLWYDHDSFRIKKGNQVVRSNLDDTSLEVDIAEYFP